MSKIEGQSGDKRAYKRERRARRLAAGLCVDCPNPLDPRSRAKCTDCLLKARANQRGWSARRLPKCAYFIVDRCNRPLPDTAASTHSGAWTKLLAANPNKYRELFQIRGYKVVHVKHFTGAVEPWMRANAK